jgi:hypothetical protein
VCLFFYITPYLLLLLLLLLLPLLLLLLLCSLLPGNGTRDRVLTRSPDVGGASFSIEVLTLSS